MHIGDTTARFAISISRNRSGWNIGASGFSTSTSNPVARTCFAKALSTSLAKSRGRQVTMRHMLEPDQRFFGRVLGLLVLLVAALLVLPQRGFHRGRALHGIRQRNRVFHG